jgi:nuclear pore complex protein Nup98-Nup96
VVDSISTVKVAKLTIFAKEEDAKEREKMESLLEVQLKHSIIEDDEDGSDCPAIYPKSTLQFQDFATASDGLVDSHYDTAIFKLGVALFDSIESKLDPTEDYPQQFIQEVTKIRRKDNVANWIRWYVASTVRNEVRSQLASNEKNIGEKNIFTFLSGGFLEEACKQAIESGDVRLATLIAQTGSGGDEEEFRLDLVDQFSVWRSGGVDAMISSDYRRIFELLSGNVTWSRGNGKREESEAVKDLKIASGLDWIRTFALFFYFDCPFGAGVEESLARYEASIGGEADIVPPLPPYLEKEIRPGSQRFRQAIRTGVYHRDVLFHLLKLFCSHEYPLENVLEPLNYGSNRLNYSIAFHISSILSKVLLDQGDGRGRDFNDRIELGFEDYDFAQSANLKGNSGKSDRLCVDYALQLETMGLWKWAAFILLHLELKQSRKENIQALLARNVDHLMLPADEEKKSKSADEEFLVDTLKIPIEWLYKAKADSACCQDNRWLEYKYLLLAKQYSTAHEVAIRFLATEGIIQHDFEFILSLFAPFQQGYNKDNDGRAEAEDTLIMQDVLGWSRGGQIYLDYIAICRSLPWLMGNIGKSHPLSHNITGGKQSATNTTNNNLMEKEEGGVAKIEKLANKIPRLIKDVRELFDGFQETVSMTVARSQMITSLYTCIRMLKSSTLVQQFNLTLHLDDDDTVSASTGSGNDKQVPVEIENLQFFANDYCSMLIGTA